MNLAYRPRYEVIREYAAPDGKYEVVKIVNLGNGFEFSVAKDDMGTQICHEGKFYPDSRDFGSVQKALDFLLAGENMSRAEDFFKRTPEPTMSRSLFNIMTGLARNLDRGSG